ncbi:MAG TPA: hypothetical protein VKE51_26990 [Vicinamibacterales bacterium]|nr:hypothetical protein [Vicinamibacterales bacterium]
MEQIVSLIRDHMHAEADAGYPLLRRIPSTGATACFDYLESISPVDRQELLEARARVAALGFVLTPPARQEILELVNSNPALVKCREATLRGPLAMGLRYQSIRMAKAVLNDEQSVAMMQQTRSTLDYVPRDDAPVPLVNDADVTKLLPAKAPQLKKLVKPLLQGLLGAKEERMPGGTMKYEGALDGTPVTVRVDYAARDVQVIYAASIPDPERKVVVIGTGYEHLFGMGGGWDYITEENAEASIGLLPELLRRLVTLRNEVKRLVCGA